MLDQELKQAYIQAIYQEKAFLIKEKAFPLRSGGTSHLYLNHRQFLTQSKYLKVVATLYNQQLDELGGEYTLGVVDSIMSPIIVGAMSMLQARDIVVIKNQELTHGTQEAIYGRVDSEIVLVDDMTSSGGTIIAAAEQLKAAGHVVNHCLISAIRTTKALDNLRAQGIQGLYITTFNDIVQALYGGLTEQEQELIQLEHNE